MELLNIPFTRLYPGDIGNPYLIVSIINPQNNKTIRVAGLIDTGADECALPATYAPLLGHNLRSGTRTEIRTGNGITTAYSHTVRIEAGSFVSQNVLIDFMPNLCTPLLGVNSFLSNFILTIDYHKKVFSLKSK